MEIERKYLIRELPENLPVTKIREIEQGYLCTNPVVRIRKDNERYELTCKSSGMMIREEYNLPLTREAYLHLREKTDGCLISKTRREIPLEKATGRFEDKGLIIELDTFHGNLAPLILAEVEFPSKEAADSFLPPSWFGQDVTFDGRYHNSYLSRCKQELPRP